MPIFSNNETQTLQGAIALTAPAVNVPTSIDEIVQNINTENSVNYYFDVITDDSIEMMNQITDNYLENNTAIQDHIGHSPLVITLSGIAGVGKNVFRYDPEVANQLLQEARFQSAKMGYGINFNNLQADSFWDLVGLGSQAKELNKLSAISVLYPPVSNYIQVAKNVAEIVDASVSKYTNIYQSIFGKENNNEQILGDFAEESNKLQQIFTELKRLRDNNIALTVTTPYGIFSNMYLQSVRFHQGNELYVTDIEITLKELRFSEVTTTAADKDVLAKYNAYAQAEMENNGKAQGEQESILHKLLNR